MGRRVCSLSLVFVCAAGVVLGETFPRDLRVDVTVNQIGFAPEASKKCVLQGPGPGRFEVIRTTDQKVVFSGPLADSDGDFGRFLAGDGIYNVSEYWTPMIPYTMWLTALLQSS